MRDASRPSTKFWHLEEWGLRWKVLAVLIVPLTIAMILGCVRVYDDVKTFRDSRAAASHVSRIPASIELEAAAGTVAGGQASGTVEDQNLTDLQKKIDIAKDVASDPSAYPAVRDSMQRMVELAQQTLDGGKTSPDDLTALAKRHHELQDNSVKSIAATLSPIEDARVNSSKTQLIDILNAQRRLFDEAVSAVKVLRNPKDPGRDLLSSVSSERALLEAAQRDYPDNDPRILDLFKGLQNRSDIIADGQATGAFDLFGARESMLDSLKSYGNLVSLATKSIINQVNDRADAAKTSLLRDIALLLFTLLAALVLAFLVARSLLSPLRRLRHGAAQVAEYDLPDAVERIKSGETIDDFEFAPVPVHTGEEIGQVARAVDDIHGQAIRLAGEQANLRIQMNDMFETLARRTKTLVDHQLRLIEDLEFGEKDPKLLESLFRLDHVAARMRRNGDNLLILAGTRVRRAKSAPIHLADVLRAAVSEVEEYRRVKLGPTPDVALVGPAASDVAHLVAELLDNALRASPPDTDVTFSFARSKDGSVLLEVADRGIGIPPAEMAVINERLDVGAVVGRETARRMGLFVVSRLADRHGMRVRMRPTFDTATEPGVTVAVLIPQQLLVDRTTNLNAEHQGELPVNGNGGEVQEPSAPAPELTPIPSPQTVAVPSSGLVEAPPTSGLPQRKPAGSIGDLPQRRPGGSPLPRREPAVTDLPQRTTAIPDLPQRTPTESPAPGLPQRQPVANGLPQRQPGGGVLPQRKPAVQAPAQAAAAAVAAPVQAQSAPAESEETRHRYRANPVKTASFFQSRTESAVRQDPPIFEQMKSAWLVDPTSEKWQVAPAWESKADEGWSAARRAVVTPVEVRTESGLPKRQPGDRLVPGGVQSEPVSTGATRGRDPEAIRANLSRHQLGVRNGRALRSTDTTDREGH